MCNGGDVVPAINALKNQLSQMGSLASLSGLSGLERKSIDPTQISPFDFSAPKQTLGQAPDLSPFTSQKGQGVFADDFTFDSAPWGTGAFGAANSRLTNDGGMFSDSLSRLNQQMSPAAATTTTSPYTGSTAGLGSLGGEWAGVDQWNNEIAAAASTYGVDPNLIKAVMKLESEGNPNAQGAPGVVGLMQVYTNVWGNGAWNYDNAANIMKGTEILKHYLDANGGDPYEAMRGYHGYGSDGYTTDTQYADIVMGNYQQLQNASSIPTTSFQNYAAQNANNPAGNAVVNIAMQYVGVPYVWGAIPGKGDNPWDTGMDCSGFTYFMDQNYGSGNLPMGSHYQYAYAQQTGNLFNDTSQLQPGDLLFWDTGNQAGGGAELNRAGHVGIYIGNGQMLHAANPSAGTIVSSLNDYMNMYGFLGGMHSAYSGGAGGYTGGTQAGGHTSANNGWSSMRQSFGW